MRNRDGYARAAERGGGGPAGRQSWARAVGAGRARPGCCGLQPSGIAPPPQWRLARDAPLKELPYSPASTSPPWIARPIRAMTCISNVLEYVPASFRVFQHVRPKLACCAAIA